MARPPRLTVFSVLADERVGGPQMRVLRVAQRLRQEGIDTAIVLPRGDPAFARLAESSGVACYRPWGYVRLPHTLGPAWLVSPVALCKWLIFFLPGTVSLTRLFRLERAQIVQANTLVNFQAALAAKLAGASLVWCLHDTVTPGLFRAILLPLLRRWADTVIPVATAVQTFYFGAAGVQRPVYVIYPPVDTARFRPGLDVGRQRRELGLEPAEKVVGMVGNVDAVKGYEFLVQAAALVVEQHPGVKFLLVGAALKTQQGYWRKIQRLVDRLGLRSHVVMAGKRDDIPEIMNLMDVFVLSSVSEAAPLVVVEAMACGRPVVATRVGGVAELVADGNTGILVPPGDGGAIARAVVHLLEHPKLAARMGQRARQRAVELFDLERCAQKHRELYLGLVGRQTVRTTEAQ